MVSGLVISFKFFEIFVQVFRPTFNFMFSVVVLLNILLMLGLLGASCQVLRFS